MPQIWRNRQALLSARVLRGRASVVFLFKDTWWHSRRHVLSAISKSEDKQYLSHSPASFRLGRLELAWIWEVNVAGPHVHFWRDLHICKPQIILYYNVFSNNLTSNYQRKSLGFFFTEPWWKRSLFYSASRLHNICLFLLLERIY